MRRIRTGDSAMPRPRPRAGDKPPRYISHPRTFWIPAFAGMTTCGSRTIEMALTG